MIRPSNNSRPIPLDAAQCAATGAASVCAVVVIVLFVLSAGGSPNGSVAEQMGKTAAEAGPHQCGIVHAKAGDSSDVPTPASARGHARTADVCARVGPARISASIARDLPAMAPPSVIIEPAIEIPGVAGEGVAASGAARACFSISERGPPAALMALV